MANRPKLSTSETVTYAVSSRPIGEDYERGWPIGLIFFSVLWVGYLFSAYFLLERLQPAWIQRLLTCGFALLSLIVYSLYTKRKEPTAAEILHQWIAQDGESSKEIGAQQIQAAKSKRVKLPLFGNVRIRSLGGLGVFVFSVVWWISPLSPVRVKDTTLDDLTIPFGEPIAAAVLVVPDGHTALVQPPLIPPLAKVMTSRIKATARPYLRGLKAMAEGRHNEARIAFLAAADQTGTDATQLNLARAQNEMYAGMFIDAERYYDAVLRDDPNNLLAMIQQGVASLQANKLENAERIAEQSLSLAQNQKTPNSDRMQGLAANLVAVVQIVRGHQLDHAEDMCVQARELFEKNISDTSFLAAGYNNLAVLYLVRAKYTTTVNFLDEAYYRWSSQGGGTKNAFVATCLCNQAVLRIAMADFSKAESLLDEAKAIHNSQLPQDHPLVAYRLATHAALMMASGHYIDAQTSVETASTIIEKNLGPVYLGNVPVANIQSDIAYNNGRYDKAATYNRAALSVSKTVLGTQHPVYADALCRQAKLYLVQNRLSDCDNSCQRAMGIYRQSLGKDQPGVADLLTTMGHMEVAKDHPNAAQLHFEQALRIQQDVFGKRHPSVALSLGNLALLDTSPENISDGEALYNQAIEIDRSFFGNEHPAIAHLLRGLAQLLVLQEKYTDAIQVLEQAKIIQENTLPASHPELLLILEDYVAALHHGGDANKDKAALLETRIKQIQSQ
jgi:tetratricopeptide (TPR) repeat protein